MQQQYFLSRHVHLCLTDDHAVLLDLRRDKYIGIGPEQTRALAAHIHGWPSTNEPPQPSTATTDKSPLQQMLQSGMLTTEAGLGKEARPVALPWPEHPLVEAHLDARPHPGIAQTLNFLRAALTARFLLKRRPIEAVVSRARERKARDPTAAYALDMERAHKLVDSFLYLRPLLFGAYDECLYDSFALVEFLARHRIHPTWVFGVQTRPFLAHSWVQEGTTVFNDTPDYVRRFTPILAV